MKREFLPKIDKAAFGEWVLETGDREGNWYAGRIEKLLDDSIGEGIYEKFITACADKNIPVRSFQEDTGGGMQYTVALWMNGYESHSVIYSDADMDITEMLASELYGLLRERLKNESFFKEYLPERAGQIYPAK